MKCRVLCGACVCRFPQRYVMAIYIALGIMIMYGQRDNLTAGIAVGIRKIRDNDTSSSNNTLNKTASDVNMEEIEWSDVILYLVMFSFFIGYIGAQIPTGYFADYFGAKWVYFTGALCSSLLTLWMPIILDKYPYMIVFASRILLGICQSVVYTSISTLMAHWVPSSERSTLGGFIFGIFPFARTSKRVISDNLRVKIKNWPIPLYFWGSLGVLWCGLYIIVIYSYPEKHPFIKPEEKRFLKEKTPQKSSFSIPSRKIMKDYALWTLIIGHVGQNYTLHLIIGALPSYLQGSPGFSMGEISTLVIVSFFAAWLTSILSGIMTDCGVSRWGWNLKWCRRIIMFTSTVGTSVFICFLYYFRESTFPAVTFFTLAAIFTGPYFSSFGVNHLDITYHLAGILQGIIICFGDFMVFFVTFTVRISTMKIPGKAWEIETWVVFTLCLVTGTHYLFAAKVERAQWDVAPEEMEENQKGT